MKNSLPKTLFPFFWHFLREYKTAVVAYGILAVVAGFWAPFNSVLIKTLINLLPQAAEKDITVLIFPAVLIVVNCILFDNFTWQGMMYIKYRFIPLVLNKVDRTLLDHTLSHSHQFFQERMAGTLSKQIFNLIEGVEKIISSSASQLLRGVSVLFMSFVIAYQVNPIFLGILVIWSVVFFTVSLFMSKKLATLSAQKAEKESALGGQIIDNLTNVFSIYFFARRNYEITRRNTALWDWKKAYQNNEMYALILHAVQGGLIAIMIAFAIFFLVYLYGKSLITAGDFALILGLSMEAGHLMWVTMYEVNELNKVLGRCKQSLDYLIVPTDIQDKSNATILKCHNGQVAFHNVTFGYKKSEPIFGNKSIEIKAGQKVGLVGYSGSGKSTFVNLILRLYDVTDGAIRIDGQDIRDVTQDSLHENIAMIPQDPSLFYRSIMENIRYGRLDATDAEVVEAAEKAHAHEFILQLAQGYQTSAGERGVQLSGGQRQRVAIARAILKNAPILILDEATSQLDSLTEHLIQESLWELMHNKTAIVIAHRLSTLLHMDRILVFNKGKIVQEGPHQQLLEDGGLYKNLWDAQVGGFLRDKI